ncbi:MAG: DUF4350 domain-containing protein [Microthrixaceae bacterium]
MRRLWWVLGIVMIAVVVLVAVGRGGDAGAFDLGSSEPDGYKALAMLLDGGGVRVERTASDAFDADPADRSVRVLLSAPVSSEALPHRVRRFADGGGVVVVTEHGSDVNESAPPLRRTRGRCNIEPLADVGRVSARFTDGPILVRPGERSCFGDRGRALVAEARQGRGTVVRIAGLGLFVNRAMGTPAKSEPVGPIEHNATLAMRLLAPAAGSGPGVHPAAARLIVVDVTEPVTGGSEDVLGLLPGRVKLVFGLSLLVATLLAWSVGRRDGALVEEEPPVRIAGSAYVEAVGGLLGRQGDVGRARAMLQGRWQRELALRLGLPATADDAALCTALARRTGRAPSDVAELLARPTVDERELAHLISELDALRREATHV